MRMVHATTTRAFWRILNKGILADKARGPLKTVWLCSPGSMGRAIDHVKSRKRIKVTDVVVIEVEVPKRWLRKGNAKGFKHTDGRDIPRERIVSATTLRQLGGDD